MKNPRRNRQNQESIIARIARFFNFVIVDDDSDDEDNLSRSQKQSRNKETRTLIGEYHKIP
jgi:hypothetical protein